MTKKTIVLSVLLAIAVSVIAQPKTEVFSISEMKFANSMFEDSKGNLWFYSNNKFLGGNPAKYDGNNLSCPNIHNTKAFYSNIVENDKGEIYFANTLKLIKYDEKSNAPIYAPEVKRTGNIFIDSKNRFWVFTAKGLVKGSIGQIKDNVFVEEPNTTSFKFVNTVYEDKDGVIWAGSIYGGVYKCEKNTWEKVSDKRVYDIRETEDGSKWMGSIEGKIYNYKDSKFETYKKGSGYFCGVVATPIITLGILPGIIVGYAVPDIQSYTEIEIDKNQEVWALIHKRGVMVMNNGKFVEAHKKYDIPSVKKATSMSKDADGNIWISTRNNGIIKYDGSQFKVYDKEIGVPKKLLGVSTDSKGNIWGIGKKFVVKISE